MLQTLKIENVALIDKVELNFDSALNVISGETGAGKSIMLDALSFVFGYRADKSLIRTGAKSMRVDAIFTELNQSDRDYVFQELNISAENEIFLSRELDQNGRNVCRVNGELVPVASIKKVCQRLVDMHGQSEHLAILDNAYQLEIIDLFSKRTGEWILSLRNLIARVKEIEAEISSLGGSETDKQNLIDLYTYQISEIENARVTPEEYDSLMAEKKEMQQFEKINEALTNCYEACNKSTFSTSAVDSINTALKAVQPIANINEHYQSLYDRLNSMAIEMQDIADTVLDDINNNVFDQERFDYIDSRLDYIKTLFRKYGGSYAGMTAYYDDIKQKLDNLLNSSERYQTLMNEREIYLKEIDKAQDKISEIRHEVANTLVLRLQKELRNLGMPNARVGVEFSRIADRYSYTGADVVEFMFSANLGFEIKPLKKVVSGGEMSRVMLAYKIVVSEVDDIHTIIFDEIDSGLSGNIASVVAEYLARLSRSKQIIAISHLPQICAMADNNIKVEKYSDAETTHTKATVLNDEALYIEIARLMGAEQDSQGLAVSRALREKSENYKKSRENQ